MEEERGREGGMEEERGIGRRGRKGWRGRERGRDGEGERKGWGGRKKEHTHIPDQDEWSSCFSLLTAWPGRC